MICAICIICVIWIVCFIWLIRVIQKETLKRVSIYGFSVSYRLSVLYVLTVLYGKSVSYGLSVVFEMGPSKESLSLDFLCTNRPFKKALSKDTLLYLWMICVIVASLVKWKHMIRGGESQKGKKRRLYKQTLLMDYLCYSCIFSKVGAHHKGRRKS